MSNETITAEFVPGSHPETIDVQMRCPNPNCRELHYTFIQAVNLITD